MQNKAKNLKFFKKDDLTLAKKQFPTFHTAQKTKWGHWSFNLTYCPQWGHQCLVQFFYSFPPLINIFLQIVSFGFCVCSFSFKYRFSTLLVDHMNIRT